MINKLRYVFDSFMSVYDIKEVDALVAYGDHLPIQAKVKVYRSNVWDYIHSQKEIRSSVFQRIQWSGKEIVIPGAGETPIIQESDYIEIKADIIAGIFFFMSGYQEVFSKERDKYGRFPFSASVQSHYGVVGLPLVNYYFDILKTALEKALKTTIQLKQKPSAFLTHDIDQLKSPIRSRLLTSFKKFCWGECIRLLKNRGTALDEYFNLSDIQKTENELGVKSTFFFLTTQETWQGVKNADYDFRSEHVQEVFQNIKGDRFGVALHGSLGSSTSGGQLKEELDSFDVSATRFHYLQYDPAVTPRILEKVGLVLDSSLGFAEYIGFRHGIAHPFYLYDFENDRPFKTLEVPLHIMDTTFDAHYMNESKEKVFKAVKEIIDESIKFGGISTILWHNDRFCETIKPGWKRVYIDIINYFKSNNVEFKTVTDFYNPK